MNGVHEWNLNSTIWVKLNEKGVALARLNKKYSYVDSSCYVRFCAHEFIDIFSKIDDALGNYMSMKVYISGVSKSTDVAALVDESTLMGKGGKDK